MFNWKTHAHCVLCVRCASLFTHSICMKCCILKVVLCSLGCLILSWMSQICINVVMCSDVFVCIRCLSYMLYAMCLPHAVFLLVSACILCAF